jgi:hypothetical protein
MVDLPRLVAFTGLAGSGKTTAAQYLVEQHGYVRTRFADPLKSMLRSIGLGYDEIDGARKELPTPLLCGKTPRWAMQTLGTEWGRNCICPDLWTTLWTERAAECMDLGGRVVVDDCRFENEARSVRRLGGLVVRIAGRAGTASKHISEAMLFEADVDIDNCGELDVLHAQLNLAITVDKQAYDIDNIWNGSIEVAGK